MQRVHFFVATYNSISPFNEHQLINALGHYNTTFCQQLESGLTVA